MSCLHKNTNKECLNTDIKHTISRCSDCGEIVNNISVSNKNLFINSKSANGFRTTFGEPILNKFIPYLNRDIKTNKTFYKSCYELLPNYGLSLTDYKHWVAPIITS